MLGKKNQFLSYQRGMLFIPSIQSKLGTLVGIFVVLQRSLTVLMFQDVQLVSDCCLMPIQLYHGENKLIFNEMTMRSALYQTNTLNWIFIVCKQTCRFTQTHYSVSKLTSLCSFSLMPLAQRRSNTYQSYILWFYPTGAQTHDLPHLRQACQPLHHRCGSFLLNCVMFLISSPVAPASS